ncbi:MAG: type II toxin-antitoxin system VapC family toxin [Myxococcaceae bacterium]
MRRAGIVDTGPLVAFIDRADQFHGWSTKALEQFEAPLVTCDAVITETWHLLGRARNGRNAFLGLIHSGDLAITFGLASESPAVFKLMAKYSDQPMSVADASLVRMAELDNNATIITLDSDFKVYRRGRSALKLVAPFVSSR